MKKGFKKFIWWNVVLTIPLVGLLLAAPFLIDVNRFKGPLLKAVNANINGEVTLGHISLKFFPFIGLSLQDLTVQNLPQSPYASSPLLKLSRLELRVELDTILQRKIVASLELKSPEINFVNTAEGSNVEALIKKSPAAPVSPKKEASPLAGLITSVSVRKISIQNAVLGYDDRTTGKTPIRLAGIGLETQVAADLGEKGAISVEKFALSLPAGTISGHGKFVPSSQVVNLDLATTPLDLKALASLSPDAKAVDVAGTVKLTFQAAGSVANPKKLKLGGSLASDQIRYEKYKLSKLASEFAFAYPEATLKGLDFNLWDGHFAGAGVVNIGGKEPAWDFGFKVTGLNMNAALTDMGHPDLLLGSGGMELKVKGEGTTEEAVKKSVSGTGNLSLKDGVFKAANIAGGVFSKELLSGVKMAGGVISEPGFVQSLASEQGTKFGDLATSFSIENGEVKLPGLKLADSGHTIALNGSVNLDMILDMKGTYLLSKEQTDSWLTDPKVRAFLVDDQGQFNVPFRMTGPATRPIIVPDVSSVTQRVAKAAGSLIKQEVQQRVTDEVGKQLQKAAPQVKPEELLKKLPKLF